MKLSHLGFIIISIAMIIFAICAKKYLNKEGFTMTGKNQEQKGLFTTTG